MVATQNFPRFLDAIGVCYPFGVRRSIRKKEIVFISQNELDFEEQATYQAFVEKALRLSTEQVALVCKQVPPKSKLLVLLGESLAKSWKADAKLGEIFVSEYGRALVTFSFKEMASDSVLKRRFWSDVVAAMTDSPG